MLNRALKTMRQFHNTNQVALANQLGISNSYLSEIESGKKEPTLDILRRYADIFDVPLSSIVVFSETLDGSHEISKIKKVLSRKFLIMMEWISAQNGDNEKKSSTL